jgi:uncharacterized protein (DUF779 family)
LKLIVATVLGRGGMFDDECLPQFRVLRRNPPLDCEPRQLTLG